MFTQLADNLFGRVEPDRVCHILAIVVGETTRQLNVVPECLWSFDFGLMFNFFDGQCFGSCLLRLTFGEGGVARLGQLRSRLENACQVRRGSPLRQHIGERTATSIGLPPGSLDVHVLLELGGLWTRAVAPSRAEGLSCSPRYLAGVHRPALRDGLVRGRCRSRLRLVTSECEKNPNEWGWDFDAHTAVSQGSHGQSNTATFVAVVVGAKDIGAKDIETGKRVAQHNGELSGGAKSTRAGRPWTLARSWGPFSRSRASVLEYQLKRRRGPRRMSWEPRSVP